jgi:hypothetical protein
VVFPDVLFAQTEHFVVPGDLGNLRDTPFVRNQKPRSDGSIASAAGLTAHSATGSNNQRMVV